MPRGYEWMLYESDDGFLYALQVDADYAEQPDRGWETPAGPGTPPLPRGWRARYVLGLEELGRTHRALVASVAAPLWDGTATTFDIYDSARETIPCTVIGRVQERSRPRPT